MVRDLVIIGGGPGGYVAAIRAAQLGAKVTLIEKDKVGGTCLNRGCVPTKALYRNAQVINDLKRAEEFGVKLESFEIDFDKILERKQQVVERLLGGISQLLKANGVEVVIGTGRLINQTTVEVTEKFDEKYELNAKSILIAAGSVPFKLPISGMDLPGVMTSDEILEMNKIPQSLVIIGGGVIGIEFAGIFSALGVKTTVIEFLPQILSNLDGDISKRMLPVLKKKGINIVTGAGVKGIRQDGDQLTVIAEGKSGEFLTSADTVLVSTGRKVNTSDLNLDALGIEYDETGIKVDEYYQTSVPGIYAVGDIIGGQMLAHVASDEGKTVVENIVGLKRHINYGAIPSCVFTFPELASVGASEEQLKMRNIRYTTGKFMFGANGKALTMGEDEGFVKVLAEESSGKVLGVHIMGPHASDLIHEAAVAVENGLRAEEIARTVHAHPTLSEAFLEAVMGTEGKAIHTAPQKR